VVAKNESENRNGLPSGITCRPIFFRNGERALSRTAVPDACHFAAAAAAWLLPGLGHWLLGERRRGAILGVAIGTLWFAGVLMGGVSTIDMKQNSWWFLGQMLTAPSLVVDQVRERALVKRQSPQDTPRGGYEPALGRTAEQAVLFTALAGLLNLLTMIDVMHRPVTDDAPATRLFGAGS
jgi:hypothetical protein